MMNSPGPGLAWASLSAHSQSMVRRNDFMSARVRGNSECPRLRWLLVYLVASCMATGVYQYAKCGPGSRGVRIHAGASGAHLGLSVLAFAQSFRLYRKQRPSFSLATLLWLTAAIGMLCAGLCEYTEAIVIGAARPAPPGAVAVARAVRLLGFGSIVMLAIVKLAASMRKCRNDRNSKRDGEREKRP